jgi:hypothetical protein
MARIPNTVIERLKAEVSVERLGTSGSGLSCCPDTQHERLDHRAQWRQQPPDPPGAPGSGLASCMQRLPALHCCQGMNASTFNP